eukprot:SRR837773.7845.p1 GENE.SRR837773.7845~~SRR837773.7845.p1  ORF type:complete len:217 (-),score=45.96 SRR837773.7845:324-974(-)
MSGVMSGQSPAARRLRAALHASRTMPLLEHHRDPAGLSVQKRPSRKEVASMDGLAKRHPMWWRYLLLASYMAAGQAIGWEMGWSPLISLYYTVQTLTTVGFGDFSFADAPKDLQLAVGIFVLLGVFVMGVALAEIFQRVLDHEREALEGIIVASALEEEAILSTGAEAVAAEPGALQRRLRGHDPARRCRRGVHRGLGLAHELLLVLRDFDVRRLR